MRAFRFFLFFIFCAGALFAGLYKIRSLRPIDKVDLTNVAKDNSSMKVYDLAQKLPWLNVSRPLGPEDLKGKVVLLDFWTYCCINCIHILPDLKKLEKEFGDALVVIGVHSAKFQNEKESENIRQAILRYEIEHPVINDADFVLWRAFDIHSWPSFVVLDSNGIYRGSTSGEGQYEILKSLIQKLIDEGRERNTLSDHKIPLRLETPSSSGLLFPGKIAWDPTHKKFWVSDSNHHRLVSFDDSGTVDQIIGSGKAGQTDGRYSEAEFFQPQGLVVDADYIYVADTSNHLVRRVDLKARKVETLLGTGKQGYDRTPSGDDLRNIPLASPWDLEIFNYRGRKLLAVAMAGNHQIWGLDLKTQQIELLAGSGREDLADGFAAAAALAQPSGLYAVDEKLYFADSETSSVRVYEQGQIKTLVGEGLFDFGLQDGNAKSARLQHALGLAVSHEHLYIADTYNHAIRDLDLKTQKVSTLISKGLKEPNDVLVVDEKLWIADTNHHQIQSYDFKTKTLKPLSLNFQKDSHAGAKSKSELPFLPNLKILEEKTGGLKAKQKFSSQNEIHLPSGHKLNDAAPSDFQLYAKRGNQYFLIQSQRISSVKFSASADLEAGDKNLVLDLTAYHCPKSESALSSCTISSARIPISLESKPLKTLISFD